MIRASAWTHVGLVRERNEDVVVLPGVLLTDRPPVAVTLDLSRPSAPGESQTLAVIDGMGGHAGGAEASRLVGLHLLGGVTDLDAAVRAANQALYAAMDRQPALRAMGATIAGVHVTADAIEVFNVGDARAYLHVDGYTSLLSVDDRSPSGNGAITQSLGGTAAPVALEIHRSVVVAEPPVRLLLCSDGISEYVEFGYLQEALDSNVPADAVADLVELALMAGAPDNASAVVLDIER